VTLCVTVGLEPESLFGAFEAAAGMRWVLPVAEFAGALIANYLEDNYGEV
jgi:hypothetical protein